MSLLVVASLKDLDLGTAPWGIPSLAGAAAAALLHLWRRNALLSIAGATALYMVLIRVMG
jgi:branched-subunit amino acid transport protein AzlD